MLIVDKPMPKNCYDCTLDCCWVEGTIPAEYAEKRKLNCPIKGELVRCGECKHRDPEDKRCDCGGHEWVKGKILPVKDDWFCADGERKDGKE